MFASVRKKKCRMVLNDSQFPKIENITRNKFKGYSYAFVILQMQSQNYQD